MKTKYKSNAEKSEKRLIQRLSAPSLRHPTEFDYKRYTKHLWKMLKRSVTTHKLDFNSILCFLSSYNCAQRLVLVHNLEFEYGYKLLDMVLEQPESLIRSCTLAIKLVQILLALDNDDTQKFKETYKSLFENCIETDIELIEDEKTIMSKLLMQLLEGQRNEEPGYSVSTAKLIAKKLAETAEKGTPNIDYDTFVKIFTRDAFPQLSAIFDMYEDKYRRPIEVAIENQCQSKIEAECFQDIVEYTRSPFGYQAKILRQALDKKPIDYIALVRTIIGHEGKGLCEIKLEYSKLYDESPDQTIENRIDMAHIKKLFFMIIAIGEDLSPNDGEEVCSDDRDRSSSISVASSSIISRVTKMKSKCSLDAFEKFVQIFKIRHTF
ncbi:unnamed protein product [Rotaria sp. Silwood2]|nr:unnamed protein product [Rotaria sp. Silwood2]CAF4451359.1 unnamed protein product [Rotaria sp. Silwood2]